MSSSNSWAELAVLFRNTRSAFLDHERAKSELKNLIPEDAKEAIGPCLLCGRKPSDAHHLRFVQPRALGRKPSDEFAVPLCCIHHRAAHRASDERTWWKAAGIDPLKVARELWKDTRATNVQNRPNLSLQAARTDSPFSSDAIDSKAP